MVNRRNEKVICSKSQRNARIEYRPFYNKHTSSLRQQSGFFRHYDTTSQVYVKCTSSVRQVYVKFASCMRQGYNLKQI